MELTQKLTFTIALFLGAIVNSFAQSYSIIPNDTISMSGIMEDQETLSIQQVNVTNNTLQLKWMKISESIPPNWETNVCDNLLCYTSLVDSGMMNPVPPSNYGFLLMHITPHVSYGTAVIRYAVWDMISPLLKDTLTYILTVNSPTGIATIDSDDVEIYPTLANDFITVKSNHKEPLSYFIATTNGQILNYGTINNGSSGIDCSGFTDGIYILSVLGSNNKSKRAQIVIQH